MSRRALIVDLDNTLIRCGEYYKAATERAVEHLATATNIPPETIRTLLDTIDLAATRLPQPFAKERMPRAFAAAALAACHIAAPFKPDVIPYAQHMVALEQIGAAVFDAPYEEYPGVRGVLEQCRAAGWFLVLYTKGDHDVQRAKIERHGYQQLFDQCVITMEKTDQVLRRLLTEFEIDMATSVVIGDSPRDDIAPAVRAGLRTVHILDRSHAWAYDTADIAADATIDTFAQLPSVLAMTPPPAPALVASA